MPRGANRLIGIPLSSVGVRSGENAHGVLENLYPEAEPDDAHRKSPAALIGSAGSRTEWELDGAIGGIKALLSQGDDLFAVVSTGFFHITGGKVLHRHVLSVDQPWVPMESTGTRIVYAVGSRAWVYDIAAGAPPEEVNTDAVEDDIQSIAFSENVLVYQTRRTLHQAEPGQVDVVPDDTGNAEARPDDMTGALAHGRRLVIFGENTVQFFTNAGRVDGFQFAPSGGVVDDIGAVSANAAVSFKNRLYWVSPDARVYRMHSDASAVKVGNNRVHESLAAAGRDLSSVRMCGFTEYGKDFVMVSGTDICWVYDTDLNSWHERRSAGYPAHHVWNVAQVRQHAYAAHRFEPKVLLQAPYLTRDDDRPIRRVFETPVIFTGGEWARMRMIELEIRSGTPRADAVRSATVQWRDDSGPLSAKVPAQSGGVGVNRRLVFRNLGAYRSRVLRFEIFGDGEISVAAIWAMIT